MANLLAGDALADPRVDRRQLFRLLAHPGDDARRTDPRRAEYVAHRLRGPILGDQLLDVHVDRRRLEALAILRRRDHAFGKRRLRHPSAIRAAVSRSLMLRHQQQALGKIEHLALLDRDRSLRIERQTAMPAHARLVRNHEIGLGDLPQRVARVSLLAAARLAGLAAQTAGARGFFFNPSLEGGFELFVLSSPNRRRSSATKASSSESGGPSKPTTPGFRAGRPSRFLSQFVACRP